MRPFLFVLAVLFVTPVSAQIVVTDGATAPRALPKFVQELSPKDYETWARWQNRQAVLRAQEESANSLELPYLSVDKTVVNSRGGSSAHIRTGSTTERNMSSRSVRGGNTTNRSGNTTTTRRGYVGRSATSWGNATAFTYPHRYNNPAYVPAGPLTAFNPFVKPANIEGEPDWNAFYLPCDEGTMTVQELLDNMRGPMDPERLYRLFLQDWFESTRP
jgi:hypothetical protein